MIPRTAPGRLSFNPDSFESRTAEDVLSTLAHEMAHAWQHHFGTPSRAGYHNVQWGGKMEEIGLMPSNTGKEGGGRTGQQMTHYIVDDGPFALSGGGPTRLGLGYPVCGPERPLEGGSLGPDGKVLGTPKGSPVNSEATNPEQVYLPRLQIGRMGKAWAESHMRRLPGAHDIAGLPLPASNPSSLKHLGGFLLCVKTPLSQSLV